MHTQEPFFLLLLTLCLHYSVCKKSYEQYTLYRSIPTKDIHLEFLRNLTDRSDVDFWTPPGQLSKPVDFVVAPKIKSAILKESVKLGIPLTIMHKDIQRVFDKQKVKNYTRTHLDSFGWNAYHQIDDIYEWLRDQTVMHPNEMELMTIGSTIENRYIMAVRITLKGANKRSKVIIEGGIHAREWISPAVVTFLIDQILNADKSGNQKLRSIANTYEWYIVPVLNPDGYEYTHTHDRLWRKNRNNDGIDLNRNFDHEFGKVGASFETHASTYCGPRSFSEKESLAMGNFVRVHSKNLEYYLSFHSYGQYFLLPYLSSPSYVENYVEMKLKCELAASKIKLRYGTKYTVGTAHETIGYMASGTSCCWVKQQYKTPYAVTIELRDRGLDGFALPTNLIMPTCLETLDGVLSLLTPQKEVPYTEIHKIPTSFGNKFYINFFNKIVIICNMLAIIIVHVNYFVFFSCITIIISIGVTVGLTSQKP